jgi:hypothetical protein
MTSSLFGMVRLPCFACTVDRWGCADKSSNSRNLSVKHSAQTHQTLQLFSFVGEGVLTVQQGCLLVNG